MRFQRQSCTVITYKGQQLAKPGELSSMNEQEGLKRKQVMITATPGCILSNYVYGTPPSDMTSYWSFEY